MKKLLVILLLLLSLPAYAQLSGDSVPQIGGSDMPSVQVMRATTVAPLLYTGPYSTGAYWEKVSNLPTEVATGANVIVFNNKIWLLGGSSGAASYASTVYSSDDGVTWTIATSTAAFGNTGAIQPCCVFNNKMWIFTTYDPTRGYVNSVWSSSDGTTWNIATTTPLYAGTFSGQHGWLYAVPFQNKVWLYATYNAATSNWSYSSSDGINWTVATTTYPLTVAYAYGGRMFTSTSGDRIWWLPGFNDFNNVWYTTNGINWICATTTAAIGTDMYFNAMAYNGKIWIINGHYVNPCRYSTDGITWTLASSSMAPLTANYSGAVDFNHRMWIISGAANPAAWRSKIP